MDETRDTAAGGERSGGEPSVAGRRHMLAVIAGAILATLGLAEEASAAKAATPAVIGTANKSTAATTVTTTAGTGVAALGATYGVSGAASGTAGTAAGVSGTAKSTSGYGVMANGKLGATGPIEIAVTTITTFPGPSAGKGYLYAKTNAKVTELHMKFPSGVDIVISSG
jgi:hypothetical protein